MFMMETNGLTIDQLDKVFRDVRFAKVLKANIVDVGTQGLQVSVGVRGHHLVVPYLETRIGVSS